tara:strand:+ start:409 stop:849 length:441 start_codon:yes stop_codon:yes gene_type:complete
MTDFTLTRVQLDDDVTIGDLTIGGHHIAWVCEDTVREIPGVPVEEWKIKGSTAIPYGRYQIKRTFSNRFQRTMPQLLEVPGFEGIRIHSGNTSVDTEGCLLPGLERRPKGVGSSALAVLEVEKWLDAIDRNGDEAWIVIRPVMGAL